MISFLREKVANYTQRTLRCVYCHDDLNDQGWICPRCSCKTHSQCASELTECPTLGCREPLDGFVSGPIQITVQNSEQEALFERCGVLRRECDARSRLISIIWLVLPLQFLFSALPLSDFLKILLTTASEISFYGHRHGILGFLDMKNWYSFVCYGLHYSVNEIFVAMIAFDLILVGNFFLLKLIGDQRSERQKLKRELKGLRSRLSLI